MLLSLLPPHGLFHHTQNVVADGSYPFLLRMDSSAPVMTNERVRPPVAPVQRVTDFMAGSAGQDADLPSSSYRLGVRAGPLHEVLFPPAGHSRIYVLFFLPGRYHRITLHLLVWRRGMMPCLACFFVFSRQQSVPKGRNSFRTCLCCNQPLRGFPMENDDLGLSE